MTTEDYVKRQEKIAFIAVVVGLVGIGSLFLAIVIVCAIEIFSWY